MFRQPGGQVPGYRRLPRTAALAVLAAAAVLLAACSSTTSTGSTSSSSPSSAAAAGNGKTLTLGTKDFTEEFIIGALYRLAPQAKGYQVNLQTHNLAAHG